MISAVVDVEKHHACLTTITLLHDSLLLLLEVTRIAYYCYFYYCIMATGTTAGLLSPVLEVACVACTYGVAFLHVLLVW